MKDMYIENVQREPFLFELPGATSRARARGTSWLPSDQGIDCKSKILTVDRVLPTENLCKILRIDPMKRY